MEHRKQIVVGLLGTSLDSGTGMNRWERWRPTVALCQHEELLIDRLELLYQQRFRSLAENVAEDISYISPETEVRLHEVEFGDPWDFERVYETLYTFARDYSFDPDHEDYLFHITTGTHVAQICTFLLTETRRFPGRLLQTAPPNRREGSRFGRYSIIDLDLSRYDRIASRFNEEKTEGIAYLKAGIPTLNLRFNHLIERIEKVAIRSSAPLLLTGPTGAGKTRLARRIYELKKVRRQVEKDFVEVNCATLRGDGAMATLFGHTKGAFTGAVRERPGLLRAADKGLLFLDEIGELGLDEQAMLLRALESRTFLPVGSDREVHSDFQLIAGTNRDLRKQVANGSFREDLLARINLWTFELPGLRERTEDIAPNLQYELEEFERRFDIRVTFNKEARQRFLRFACAPEARWSGNFRDLNAAVTRMATLAPSGRINVEVVDEEIDRLKRDWFVPSVEKPSEERLARLLGPEKVEELDRFDRVQLADVMEVCAEATSLSEAGRRLFAKSRARKKSSNDADRLRKYLARFGLEWKGLKGAL